MGTISSGTGLISGLDITSIVTQLMAIESQPLKLLQARIATLENRQTAYGNLGTQLLAVKTSLGKLAQVSLFNSRTATSSNTNVLTATASARTPVGTTSFTVRSLVSTHQLVSKGFSSSSSAVGAGQLVFESAQANVAPSTSLNVLNGGDGVRRGVIRITDCSGASADIDLTAALTVDDVLEAINTQSQTSVQAYADGGRLVIEDLSGGTATNLRITDLGGGYAAADLGIAGLSTTGTIEGTNLVALTESTMLTRLNDGIGVRYTSSGADLQFSLANGNSFDVDLSSTLSFSTNLALLNDGQGVRLGTIRITNQNGESAEVDLSGAQTIQDVKGAIDAADIGVTITSLTGSTILLSDSTGGTASNLIIEDVTGYAAADLGITADTDESTVQGTSIYRLETLGTVMRAIQYAAGNDGQLSVSLSGNGLVLTDNTTGLSTTMVTALNGSQAARDLGLLGGFDGSGQLVSRDLIAGLNTVLLSSLKGGSGLTTGTLNFTLRDGSTVDSLDFSQAQTLADVLNTINATGKLSAEVSSGGTQIQITDLTTGSGTFSAAGDMADTLGLSSTSSGRLVSEDLQLQYVTESTQLSALNSGKGITYGSFKITTASGVSKVLTLTSSTHKTIGDVINAINNLNIGVVAQINANGDGIELQDTTTGSGRLTVDEQGTGTTAFDLGILGTADDSGVLVGSQARTIELNASDSLDSLVKKINDAGAGVTASLINDGSTDNAYRLVLTSQTSGTQGLISFSTTISSLSLDTLTEAQDAKVVIGDSGSTNAVVVSSSSNTIDDLIPGLTLNLVGISENPVQVTINRDTDSIVQNVKDFIDAFNETMDLIDEYTKYNSDTEEKGILFGESTARQLQSRLYSIVTSSVSKAGLSYQRLSDLGIMVDSSSGSARLTLERTFNDGTVISGEDKLLAAIKNDPEGVKKLFSLVEVDDNDKLSYVGIAARLNRELTVMTTTGGLLINEDDRLQSRIDQFDDRAEAMQDLLNMKEERLYAQFEAMELALASLQAQESSLSTLSQLVSSLNSSS